MNMVLFCKSYDTLPFFHFQNAFIYNLVDVLFVNQVSKEVSPAAAGVVIQTDRISKSVHEIFSLQSDDGNVTKLGSKNLSEAVKDSHQIVLSEANKGAFQKRRRGNLVLQ